MDQFTFRYLETDKRPQHTCPTFAPLFGPIAGQSHLSLGIVHKEDVGFQTGRIQKSASTPTILATRNLKYVHREEPSKASAARVTNRKNGFYVTGSAA